MNAQVYNRRFIAFFDVIGFGNKIKNHNLVELHQLYLELINKANRQCIQPNASTPAGEQIKQNNFFYYKIFSDSIFLVSDQVTTENVNKFILATNQLMELFFSEQFPLRGVITIDDVLIDRENDILLAKKLPDLVESEKIWNWSGAVLLKDTHEIIFEHVFGGNPDENTAFLNSGNPCVFFNVPRKSGGNSKELCLNWVHMNTEKGINSGLEYLQHEKKEHSEIFIRYIKSLPLCELNLTKEYLPVVKIKLMKTRSNCRILALNQEGMPADIKNLSLSFYENAEIIFYSHLNNQLGLTFRIFAIASNSASLTGLEPLSMREIILLLIAKFNIIIHIKLGG